MIYLLAAIGLSLGGSTHLHTNNTQNNTNNNQCGKVRAVPRLCEFYPGICLTTEKKSRKNPSQGTKNLGQVKKNLSETTKTSVRVQYTYNIHSRSVKHDAVYGDPHPFNRDLISAAKLFVGFL